MAVREVCGVPFELVLIPQGSFRMGTSNEQYAEAPAHTVNIARPFYVGRFPVTQGQWKAVTGGNPSVFPVSDDHPVDSVSWLDAARFCETLSEKSGMIFRLPAEAEWEYCCRGGTAGDFFFSAEASYADEASIPQPIRRELQAYAWFDENSRDTTHAVGLKQPNPFGLHEITGNVWEWCADLWNAGYTGAPGQSAPWLEQRKPRPLRCLRGGAWDMNAFRCRSSYRSWDWETQATNRFGLRVCAEAF